MSKGSKRGLALAVIFLLGSLGNWAYFLTLKAAPYKELKYISNKIAGQADPVTLALKLITKSGESILLYSISQEGEVVNINDFESREIPSIPKNIPELPVTYNYGNSNYLVSFVQNAENGVMLIYDLKVFQGLKILLINEILLVILFIFLYFFLLSREKVEKSELENAGMMSKNKIQNALSHELKTPLTAIMGYHDLLSTAKSLEVAKSYSKKAQANVERLARSIDQILSFSQSEQNFTSREGSANIKTLLKELIDNYPTHDERKIIHLESKFDKTVARPEVIELILSNMISNYIRHSSQESELFIKTILLGGKLQIQITQSNTDDSSRKGQGLGLEIIDYLAMKYEIKLDKLGNYNYTLTI